MPAIFYLECSMKRNFKKHLSLFLIMTSAFTLPMIFSIFRDSLNYGTEEMFRVRTHNYQTFILDFAKTEYLAYFSDIEGLSVFFENDTIYMKADEDILSDSVKTDKMVSLVSDKFKQIGDERSKLSGYIGYDQDPSWDFLKQVLLAANVVIIIITVYILTSVYTNHLDAFTRDIGMLYAIGARKRQVRHIFIFEFITAFLLAAIIAAVLTVFCMYWLISNFLQAVDTGSAMWLIFRVDPCSMIMNVSAMFCALAAALCLSLWRRDKRGILASLNADDSGNKPKHCLVSLKPGQNPQKTLAFMLFQRTRRRITSCLFFALPVTVAVMFFVVLTYSYTEAIEERRLLYELSVQDIGTQNYFTPDEIEFVESIDGVDYVSAEYTNTGGYFAISNPRADERFAYARIDPYKSLASEFKNADIDFTNTSVVVNKHKYLNFETGDTVILKRSDKLTPEQYMAQLTGKAQPRVETQPVSLVVADVLNLSPLEMGIGVADDLVTVYVSDEVYHSLTESFPINMLKIKLYDSDNHAETEAVLNEYFSANIYEVQNIKAEFDTNNARRVGLSILSMLVSAVVFGIISFILYVKLSAYAAAETANIRLLSILGADAQTIRRAYMFTPFVISLFCVIVSLALGLSLSAYVFKDLPVRIALNYVTVPILIILSAIIFAAFNLPVYISVKNKLKGVVKWVQ